ncbi:MAG: hypothetical protein IJ357_06160 [Oscillospiraceae bacterium]|nr:hypothetical protein [Oscillospiraceae bacterium]
MQELPAIVASKMRRGQAKAYLYGVLRNKFKIRAQRAHRSHSPFIISHSSSVPQAQAGRLCRPVYYITSPRLWKGADMQGFLDFWANGGYTIVYILGSYAKNTTRGTLWQKSKHTETTASAL